MRRKTRSTNSSGPEGAASHVDDQLRLARDQLQAGLLRARVWAARPPISSTSTTRSRRRARGKMISLATETERTLFFDFLPVDLGHHPRLQGQVPPLHRAGAGLLQRLPQADPQGRGRRRVRGRQPDRADGSEHRGDAEPVRQHGAARLRPDPDSRSSSSTTSATCPTPRRSPSCRPRSTRAGRWRMPPRQRADARPVPRRRVPGPAAGRAVDRAGAVLRGGGRDRATACSTPSRPISKIVVKTLG